MPLETRAYGGPGPTCRDPLGTPSRPAMRPARAARSTTASGLARSGLIQTRRGSVSVS